jgi:hypothetical protein
MLSKKPLFKPRKKPRMRSALTLRFECKKGIQAFRYTYVTRGITLVTNSYRGQPPGHHDQVPAWRCGHAYALCL